MKGDQYDDPKYPAVVGKVACIIPLYIPAGRKKDYGYFIEDKFESLKKTLAAHKHFKPGVEYDLYLVNNNSPQDTSYFEGQGYKMLHRQNEGYGFGAWKHAYEVLEDDYDFFLFTEDDNAPAKDDWLLEIMTVFMSEKNIGAVGNFVEAHGHDVIADEVQQLRGTTRDILYCLDGAYTFTSKKILEDVYEIGGLPVYPCHPLFDRSATVNELAFQQPILELGYKIVGFGGMGRMLIHGSEIFSGDLANRGPVAPIINHNAGLKVPEIAEIFAWYGKE